MYKILASLPAETLLRFKCVCKDWYNLINDPVFIQLHLNQSLETDSCHHHHRPFVFANDDSLCFGDDIDSPSQAVVKFNWRDNIEYEHVGFIGSSNGLVCLNKGGKSFIICNPLTRTFKQVLFSVEVEIWNSGHCLGLYGFGYDSQHDDYKVVLMKLQEDKETWVYSLKTDSWRKAPTQYQSPLLKKLYKPLCGCVFGHGMIHCILRGVDDYSRLYLDSVEYTYNEQPQIARFNLSSEEWEHEDLEIWIMKEYGIKESWTKLLRISHNGPKSFNLGPPIAYSRTTRQVLWLNSINDGHAGIVCYDMQLETRKAFKFSIPKRPFHATVNLFAPSLVSIPGSSHMKGQTHQTHEEDNAIVSSSTLPSKKEKKKGKKQLYYSWSRTS
ncbi:F-box protein CPR1 [Bienertia sinuspersici]